MRIAMLTNSYAPFVGGIPISIERLSDGLRALGHQVYIFAPDYGQGQTEDPYVIRCRTLTSNSDRGIMVANCFDRCLLDKFRELSFDVIHTHHPMLLGRTGLYLKRRLGIPVVYTYHTRYEEYLHHLRLFSRMDEGRLTGRIMRFGRERLLPEYLSHYMDRCDLVFAPSESIRRQIGGEGERSVRVLPTGLPDEAFGKNEARSREIRRSCLGGDGEEEGAQYLLCSVSRLEKEKNIGFLLEAMAELKGRMGGCFRLMLVGEGTERETLHRKAQELGIAGQVIFAGRVDNGDVRDYLAASDLFVFASKSETQGIVLLEAMAAGRPVVAVSSGGVDDLVQNGVNGYRVSEEKEQFAEAVKRMLTEPGRCRRMEEGALGTAKEHRAIRIAMRAEVGYLGLTENRGEDMDDFKKLGKQICRTDCPQLFRPAVWLSQAAGKDGADRFCRGGRGHGGGQPRR